MPKHTTQIHYDDKIAVVPPANGATDWLRVLYGKGADQLWVDRNAAEKLRDALTKALAELDAIEQSGSTTDQRVHTALEILASQHMGELPGRMQAKISNKLAAIKSQNGD
jgi:hypothetical protein